ncbi:ATP-dependent helicase [Chloroflexota bacterium]
MDYSWLDELNTQQREAATYGDGPLLIVAGAGTGKTKTLSNRVSYLISQGVQPERILLLTFTRRAAEEMLRRATSLAAVDESLTRRIWGGTFHATGNRLLRIYAKAAGLSPEFTIMDQSDAEDFMNVVRNDMGLSTKEKRFPRKSTCLAIYSRRVNGNETLGTVVKKDFPWCVEGIDDLNQLFRGYVERKQNQNVLDYDDLLLYWYQLLQEETLRQAIDSRFDHILVDEYQDTNPLQSRILQAMRRDNKNITVVGDDAQSIYSFRSATVRNMLDFPDQFPGTKVVALEQNYRSLQPILQTTNCVIAQATERYSKELWSERRGEQRPQLITCVDETDQDATVIKYILQHYEQGIPLHKQAVLFRAASHSASLELALSRANIPFHKYGGLKFLEMAHVKDLISILRMAENPKDEIAWFRILQLLEGVGPVTAAAAFHHLQAAPLETFKAPAPAKHAIAEIVSLMKDLETMKGDKPSVQVERISKFYLPLLEQNYDDPAPRASDIEHLGRLAERYETRQRFLTDLVLDPPQSTGDLAGLPTKDEDWLVLSTIHSAKGLEWDAVYLIHAADGCLPSDMATGNAEQIEEELRLTYVALTRARDFLRVLWPMRYYSESAGQFTDNHTYAQACRFFTKEVTETMNLLTGAAEPVKPDAAISEMPHAGIHERIKGMWD